MKRDTLLVGILNSLKTAKMRLQEATQLYEGHFYSGTVIFSLFGQEELGRAVALHQLYSQTPVEGEVSLESLQKLGDHEGRLGTGRFGHLLRAPAPINSNIQKALASGSKEAFLTARAPLDNRHKRKARRQPADLQELREHAQYVDPTSNYEWNEPWTISQVTAYEILSEAISHLFNHWFQFVLSAPLMAAWQTLPESSRPSYPPRVSIPTLLAAWLEKDRED